MKKEVIILGIRTDLEEILYEINKIQNYFIFKRETFSEESKEKIMCKLHEFKNTLNKVLI
jgi:hypothetical protein